MGQGPYGFRGVGSRLLRGPVQACLPHQLPGWAAYSCNGDSYGGLFKLACHTPGWAAYSCNRDCYGGLFKLACHINCLGGLPIRVMGIAIFLISGVWHFGGVLIHGRFRVGRMVSGYVYIRPHQGSQLVYHCTGNSNSAAPYTLVAYLPPDDLTLVPRCITALAAATLLRPIPLWRTCLLMT